MASEVFSARESGVNPINGVSNSVRSSSRNSAIDKNVRLGFDESYYGAKSAKSKVLDYLDAQDVYVSSRDREFLKGKTFSDLNDGSLGTGRSPVGSDIDETLFQAMWNLENRGKIKMKQL